MFDNFSWAEVLEKLKISAVSIVSELIIVAVVFFIAHLILNKLTKLTTKGMDDAAKLDDAQRGKELMTSMTLLRSLGRYAVYLAAVIIIAYTLGMGSVFSNMLAAAGIGTLAISFGAQSVVKDVVTGAFLLFEKQYSVGDYVQINGYTGTVTAVALRCTYIQSWKGEKVIIPNGQITTVTNYSGETNMAVIEVPTSYEDNTEHLRDIIQEVADKYYAEHEIICAAAPTVKAITAFNDSSVSITVYLRAKARNHYTIQNDLRYLIKKRFDEEGISIPYNQITVHQEGK